jgi:hypothetical protein
VHVERLKNITEKRFLANVTYSNCSHCYSLKKKNLKKHFRRIGKTMLPDVLFPRGKHVREHCFSYSLEEKIYSWVFDSNGGFGTDSWIQDGESWYISSTYKLSDARVATATHIITKVDDNTYTFSSFGRDIDGDLQPSIGPFTFTKQ